MAKNRLEMECFEPGDREMPGCVPELRRVPRHHHPCDRVEHEPAWTNPRLANLLVPIDFSEDSRRLLRWSVMVAEALGTKVSLVGVADCRTGADVSVAAFNSRLGASALDRWRHHEIPGELQGETMAPTRADAAAIAVAARELSADVVVAWATRRNEHGWPGWRPRDRSERVLRHLPCPVLSINPARFGPEAQPPSRFAPMGWQTILVWDDGESDPAPRVAWAAEWSRRTHTAATLLRYFSPALRGLRTQPFATRRFATDERERAERQLMARIRAQQWGSTRPRILFRNGRGDAASVCEMAARMCADLVVIRSPGCRPWWRALGADPADELIPTAPCPVLRVPG
jgi:nucleotide-binding universal stress UspA family protein